MHGWAISERIQTISRDVLQVNQGSLYPALHRLEHRRWIKAEWGVSELGRRARFYSLTAAGRKRFEVEAEDWSKLSEAISRVLKMA
jgi:PadR family transcriptional regulator PadR